MAEGQAVFVCGQCGHTEAKWAGRCPDCGVWNSFTEELLPKERGRSSGGWWSGRALVAVADPSRLFLAEG